MKTLLAVWILIACSVGLASHAPGAAAQPAPAGPSLPIVENVTAQPLAAQVARVEQALAHLGSPLPARTHTALQKALQEPDGSRQVRAIQAALDPYCLLGVHINPESRVKVAPGPARPALVEQGWRQFLVKVQNEAGVTAELQAVSPNAKSLYNSPQSDVANR